MNPTTRRLPPRRSLRPNPRRHRNPQHHRTPHRRNRRRHRNPHRLNLRLVRQRFLTTKTVPATPSNVPMECGANREDDRAHVRTTVAWDDLHLLRHRLTLQAEVGQSAVALDAMPMRLSMICAGLLGIGAGVIADRIGVGRD